MTPIYILSVYILSTAISTVIVVNYNKNAKRNIMYDENWILPIAFFVVFAPLTLPLSIVIITGVGIGLLINSLVQLKNPLAKKKDLQ